MSEARDAFVKAYAENIATNGYDAAVAAGTSAYNAVKNPAPAATPSTDQGGSQTTTADSAKSGSGKTTGSDIYGRSIDSEEEAGKDALKDNPSKASGFLNNLLNSIEAKASAANTWLGNVLNSQAMQNGQAISAEQVKTDASVPFEQPDTNLGDTNNDNSLYALLEKQRRRDNLDAKDYADAVKIARSGGFREYYGLSPMSSETKTEEEPKSRPSGVSRGALDAAKNLSAEQTNTIVKDSNGKYTNLYSLLESQRAQDRIDERNYADGVKIARSGGFRDYYGLKPMSNPTEEKDDGETIGDYEARLRSERAEAAEEADKLSPSLASRTPKVEAGYDNNNIADILAKQAIIDRKDANDYAEGVKIARSGGFREYYGLNPLTEKETENAAEPYTEYVSNNISPREKTVREYEEELKAAKQELARADEAAAWDVTDGMETSKAVKAAEEKVRDLEQKLYTAQQNEKASQYNAMFNSPSFDNAAADGNTMYDPNADVFRQKDPGNKIRYADDHQEMLSAALADTQKDDYVKVYENLSLATKDERDLYSYILATNGSKSADEFLEYIRPALNARAGKKISDSIEADTSTASRIARETVLGGYAGYQQAKTGLAQNLSKDALAQNQYQYAFANQNQNILERTDGKFSVERTLMNLSNTVGNMIPAIVAGTFFGPEVANVIAGLSTRGTTYNQLVNEGISPEMAKKVANITGSAEAITGYALSGISQLGGKLTGMAASKLTEGITNSTAKAFAELGIDTLSEDMEEVLQNKVETWARNQYLGEDGSYAFNQEDLDTVILTTLSTVLLQGTNMATNAIANTSTESVVNNTNNDGLAVDPRTGQVSELSLAEADAKAYAAEQASANTPVVEEPAPEYTPQEESTKTDTGMPDMRAEMDDANALITSLNGTNVSNSDAMRIINDPVLTMVFEEQTGIKLEGTNSEKRAQIKNALAETVTEQNTQQAAETETNQQTNETNTENQQATETTEQTEQNTEKSAADKQDNLLNLAFSFNQSGGAVEAEALSNAIDSLSSEELSSIKSSLEANENRSDAENILLNAIKTNESSQQTNENPLTEEENNVNTETPSKPSRHSGSTSTNQENTNNPDNPNLGDKEVKTQSSFNNLLNEEETNNPDLDPEKNTHVQHKDTLVDEEATRRVTDSPEQARNYLMNKDPESEHWSDVDMRTAEMLLEDELENIRAMDDGAEKDAAYAELAKLRKQFDKAGTALGQALRQRQRFTSPEEMVTHAAELLYGEDSDTKTRKMSPEEKSQVIDTVDEYSKRLDSVMKQDASDPNASKDVIQLIKDLAEVRKTKAIFDKDNKILSSALEAIAKQDGGIEFLRQVATAQTNSIASDYLNPGIVNKLKTIKFINMLSGGTTITHNIGANAVYGYIMEAVNSNFGGVFDAIMSKRTGRKTTGFERLSSDWLKGGTDAGLRSFVEVSLDADAENTSSKYGELNGRTFKPTGNFVEKFLSSLERNQAYLLNTTDEIAKGRSRAEVGRSLKNNDTLTAEEKAQIAEDEALHRTLQDDSVASRVGMQLRDAVDNIGIKDRQGGKYGLGTDLMPFAKVPINSAKSELEMNPVTGALNAFVKIGKVMAKGSNATASEQRAAAKAAGAALNGATIVALSAIGSAAGVIRYSDSDDKDEKQLDKAQRKNGLQINWSAMERMITGGDASEQDGDKWVGLGWLPQLNSLMILGNMVNEDYQNYEGEKDGLAKAADIIFSKDFLENNAKAAAESVMEFPAVSTITGMINAAKYSSKDEDHPVTSAIGAALADKVANTATSFIVPNIVRQNAAGLDSKERDLYSADNRVDQAIDYIKAGIPGLRETLPTQKDNFGNDIENDGGFINYLNKTILPAPITTDRESEFIDRLTDIADQTGNYNIIPDKGIPTKLTINGKDYDLTKEEGEKYRKLAGDQFAQYYSDAFNSDRFNSLPVETQSEVMQQVRSYAYDLAEAQYAESHGLKYTPNALALTLGVNSAGEANDKTALSESNVVDYYINKNLYDAASKVNDETGSRDYASIDQMVQTYNSADENLKTVMGERFNGLKSIADDASMGISSEQHYAISDSATNQRIGMNKSSPTSYTKYLGIVYADVPEEVKAKYVMEKNESDGDAYVGSNLRKVYSVMSKYGYSVADSFDFYDMMNYTLTTESGQAPKESSNSTISRREAANALFKSRLTPQQQEEAYKEMRTLFSNYTNDWKNYRYSQSVGNSSYGSTTYQYTKNESSRKNYTENPVDPELFEEHNYLAETLGIK